MTALLLEVAAFNAAYASTIDADELERWPGYFTERCHYRITHVENEREKLPAGIVWADSQAMLEDRVSALREANIYERQRYRHLLGLPVLRGHGGEIAAETPFLVARIMATGQTELFASGVYRDRFERGPDGGLLLAERVAVCDSTVIDTLLALPL